MWTVVAGLLVGCADNIVFQAAVPIATTGWDRSFTPEFVFDVTDTVSRHHLFIDVRHTGDYPYSDLYLFVDLTGPGGRHARDTVRCLLADPSGRWYGRGTGFIFADRYDAHVLYKLNNRFPAAGRYTLKLEQAMRTEVVKEVLDVGISLERAQ